MAILDGISYKLKTNVKQAGSYIRSYFSSLYTVMNDDKTTVQTEINNIKSKYVYNNYVWINLSSRSIAKNESNYLLVNTINVEGEPTSSLIEITQGSAAITLKKSGKYLIILRTKISTSSPNVSFDLYKKEHSDSEYIYDFSFGDQLLTGMMSRIGFFSTNVDGTKIAIKASNINTKAATVSGGMIILPL